MSDQVPFGVTQVAQSIRLRSKLLHPVLAENAQAGCVRFADAFYGKRLAYAHQLDFVWIAARPPRRCCDPFPHPGDIFRDRHKAKTTRDTKYHEGWIASRRDQGQSDWTGETPVSPRTLPYIMPTGGAGSLG